MELTNKLKGKINEAGSEEEVKEILAKTKQNVEDAGIILDDEELDKAAGGYHAGSSDRYSIKFW